MSMGNMSDRSYGEKAASYASSSRACRKKSNQHLTLKIESLDISEDDKPFDKLLETTNEIKKKMGGQIEVSTKDEMTNKELNENLKKVLSCIESKQNIPWWKEKLTELIIGILIVVVSTVLSVGIFSRLQTLDDRVYNLGLAVGYDSQKDEFINIEDPDSPMLQALNSIQETLNEMAE